jgi:hypothetical protein
MSNMSWSFFCCWPGPAMSAGAVPGAFGFGRFTHSPDIWSCRSTSRTVCGGDAVAQPLRLVAHEVEHAAAGADFAEFLGLLRGCAGEEKFGEHLRWPVHGGDVHAIAGVGKATVVSGEDEAVVACLAAEVRGELLVERDGVLEVVGVVGIRRAGEHHGLGLVPAAAGVRMAEAGDDGEVIAHRLEVLQMRRERVAAACGGRHEDLRIESKRRADGDEPARIRDGGCGGGRDGLHHGFEERQRERDAGGAQEGAAVEWCVHEDGSAVYLRVNSSL